MKTKTIQFNCNNDRSWPMTKIVGRCRDIIGYPKDRVLSGEIALGDLISGHLQEKLWILIQEYLKTQLPYQVNYTIEVSKNERRVIFEQAQGIYDNDGELIEITGFMTDVTGIVDEFAFKTKQEKLIELKSQLQITAQDARGVNRIYSAITDKETIAIIYMCQGYSMKETAQVMHVSPRTVEAYLVKARKKLCCYSKSELRQLFYSTAVGQKIISDY